MTVKNAADDVLAAANFMADARDASTRRHPRSDPMMLHELQQSADTIDKVIRARSKLQQLRNRAAALEDALARFKARRRERCA
jgi:hypothetical protein